ncbi:unnamed protein product [Soboliphyme baturini]|uniref:RRM domain-containing protein n=1 Tax=Soboliphyme baturini TaxID=241478 RepID=A0A3P8CH13_9BILA|nr:unnamed protein product [Soboliphyme baturini]
MIITPFKTRFISDHFHWCLGETLIGLEAPRGLPSPPRYPVSNIIHVRCLTRPFTTRSLFELLGQFGAFSKEEFWIDGIKSHCLVKYDSEESALHARNALHNLQWPPSNQKVLRVDFATQDDLDRHCGATEKKRSKPVGMQEVVGVHVEPQPSISVEVDSHRVLPREPHARTTSERRQPENSVWSNGREWDHAKSSAYPDRNATQIKLEEERQWTESQKKRKGNEPVFNGDLSPLF